MIDALLTGTVRGTARQGTGKNGSSYVTVVVRVAGMAGDPLFCSAITFSHSAQAELLALEEGQAVALVGSLTPKVYAASNGGFRPTLDMVAHSVLTINHVAHKRQADEEGE